MAKTKVASKSRISGALEAANGAATSKPVVLAELRIRVIQVTVEGLSPLITHAWSKKAVAMIEDKQQGKASSGRKAKVPQEEMDAACYRDEDGNYCVPARAFKDAFVSAATSLGDKTRYPQTKLRQGMFVRGDLLPIKAPKPTMRTDMVRLNKKTADVRYRPEFFPWDVTMEIEFNESVFSQDEVCSILELAGFAVGICEWRPECNGNNGRFRIKKG